MRPPSGVKSIDVVLAVDGRGVRFILSGLISAVLIVSFSLLPGERRSFYLQSSFFLPDCPSLVMDRGPFKYSRHLSDSPVLESPRIIVRSRYDVVSERNSKMAMERFELYNE